MSYQDVINGVKPAAGAPDASSKQLAAGVFKFATAVSSFKGLVNDLGSRKDTIQHREKIIKTRENINQLVKDVSDKLKESSRAAKTADLPTEKKNEVARLAKDFESALNDYQSIQKRAKELELSCVPFVPQVFLPSSYTESELGLTRDDNDEERALLVEQRRQEVLRQENEILDNENRILEREQDMKVIQQEIVNVHDIMKDLGVLVREQGQTIVDIDTHIQNTRFSTQDANEELSKARKHQKSGASLTCLMFVLFGLLLLVLLIIFLA